ncbi:MAG: GspE/PulE family protein [bacterium]
MAGMQIPKTFASILIGKKIITRSQLDLARQLERSKGEELEKILLKMGWVNPHQILEVQSELWNIPLLSDSLMEKRDSDMLRLVPVHLANRYLVFPLYKEKNGELMVAMADPFNLVAIDDLKRVTQSDIHPVIASPEAIKRAIAENYSELEEVEEEKEKPAEDSKVPVVEEKSDDSEEIVSQLEDFKLEMEEKDSESGEADEEDINQLRVYADDPPVVKLVNYIIVQAVNERASDIHVEPHENGVTVRCRTDGTLFELIESPKRMKRSIISRLKILSNMDISEKRIPQDGSFSIKLNKQDIDFRVNSLPTVWGEKIVLRILKKDAVTKLRMDDLGFHPDSLEMCKRNIYAPHGLILVTGPTGSGKSTTLYTIINQICSPKKNIITVEDPVEYRIPGIQQVQVKSSIGFTFASALRAILRQDPDIIMIGEIRDQETAQIAVRSSLTGHLVFSTLHTNDAIGAVVRLVDMGVPPFLVADSVSMAIAQRLVKRVCNNCKKEYKPSDEMLSQVQLDIKNPGFVKGKGCSRCKDSGFSGRLAIHEFLEMTPTFRKMITEGRSDNELRTEADKNGMMHLMEDGLIKAAHGQTTCEEVLSVSMEE